MSRGGEGRFNVADTLMRDSKSVEEEKGDRVKLGATNGFIRSIPVVTDSKTSKNKQSDFPVETHLSNAFKIQGIA